MTVRRSRTGEMAKGSAREPASSSQTSWVRARLSVVLERGTRSEGKSCVAQRGRGEYLRITVHPSGTVGAALGLQIIRGHLRRDHGTRSGRIVRQGRLYLPCLEAEA